MHKRPIEPMRSVGDYRRSLVRGLVHQVLNARFGELAREPDAAFLAASASDERFGRTLEAFVLGARVVDGGVAAGLEALAREAARVDRFGFGSAELERARQWLLAGYERTYNERERMDHGGLAFELIRHFLEAEPVPGIAYEYELARALVPGISADETAAAARALVTETDRVVLATLPETTGTAPPSDAALRDAMRRDSAAEVTAWRDEPGSRELIPGRPRAGRVAASRLIPQIGVTVLTLSNGAVVWLKPTDFKNDQVVFSSYARGGTSLAAPAQYHGAVLSPALVALSGGGGHSPVDLDKLLPGRLIDVSPYVHVRAYAWRLGPEHATRCRDGAPAAMWDWPFRAVCGAKRFARAGSREARRS